MNKDVSSKNRGAYMMRFGSHISIRNGYYKAAQHAKQIAAKAFQYFPKNPRSLSIKEVDEQDATQCANFCKDHDILTIAHTPYPTNLVIEKANSDIVIHSLLNDLHIANLCGSIGVVVHFGVIKNENDPLEGYKRMIDMLNEILSKWTGNTLLLIENNAGKSGPTGTTLEELVQIRNLTDYPEKIGFCFDSCHGFASGLWNGDNWSEIEAKGYELGYFDHLKAVHLNNSAYPTRSMKDRHANIHNGHIKVQQMIEFISSQSISQLPLILETPTTDQYSHKDEIDYLNSL